MAAGAWNRGAGPCPLRAAARAALVLVASALVASLTGCSLIGLGVGSAVDATRSREPLLLTPERAAYLPAGTPVTLVMADSSTIIGFVLDPQVAKGDSRQTGVRVAHLRSQSPASIDTLLVPLDQISYARAAPVRHGARTGFRAGMKADLIVLGVAAAAVLFILLILLLVSSSGFSFG